MSRGFASVPLIITALSVTPILLARTQKEECEREVPAELKVPTGHKLFFKAEAKGVQIYKSVEGKDGKLEWVLEAPLADLFGSKGNKMGCHYEGPSWEALDGSKVTRDNGETVKIAAAPNPKEDVPWLLIKVKADAGKEGALSKASYVQRVHTKGGKSPAEAPLRTGTKIGVEYKASYLFYGLAD